MPPKPATMPPEHQALSSDERALLTWLLEHGGPGAADYLSQVPAVSVAGRCTCGCPTLDLAVAGRLAAPGPSTIIADFCGTTPDGVLVGVMVHVREGILSELEGYSLSGAKTFSFPHPEALQPLRRHERA